MAKKKAHDRFTSIIDVLQAFPTEEAATAYLIKKRWPLGVTCVMCGYYGRCYRVNEPHLLKCGNCRRKFSMRKHTLFKDSKLPLRLWLAAMWLFASNRKGISSLQLARELGVNRRSGWFMLCRIRQIADRMKANVLAGIVEVDECYVGGRERNKHHKKRLFGNWAQGKQIVMGAVQRHGNVITRCVDNRDAGSCLWFVMRHVRQGATVYTDEHAPYQLLTRHQYQYITHSTGQYANGNCHTQSIESFWALVKRAHKGIYHWWSNEHIDRYLREFEFRWNYRAVNEHGRLEAMLSHIDQTRLSWALLTT